MKKQKWDESLESSREIFDTTASAVEADEIAEAPASGSSDFTALRRRIEQRMDSKRIAHEYDWDNLDEMAG